MIERIVRADGTTRYLSSNGQVVTDETGSPVRMRGTCVDITDRVLAEQQREEAAQRLGELNARRRQAGEINDNVMQGLTAAVYSLELGDQERCSSYLEQTLSAVRTLMEDMGGTDGEVSELVRSTPASLRPDLES